jgi:hypothetical protein
MVSGSEAEADAVGEPEADAQCEPKPEAESPPGDTAATLCQIDKVKREHLSKLDILDAPESDRSRVQESGNSGKPGERLAQVQDDYAKFIELGWNPRIDQFRASQSQIEHMSAALGLELGEFGDIGETDFSMKRLSEFRERVKELDALLTQATIHFSELQSQIGKLSTQLQEPIPRNLSALHKRHDYSEKTLGVLREHKDKLQALFESRWKSVAEMAVEITRLWDLLAVNDVDRRQFMASHTLLTAKNVQDCIEEAERLTALRDRQLHDLIGVMDKEIRRLAVELTYSDDQINGILSEYQRGEVIDVFNNYEAGLIRIKRVHVAARPIIELIKQRDAILKEYEGRNAPRTEPPSPPKASPAPSKKAALKKGPSPRNEFTPTKQPFPKKDLPRPSPPDTSGKLKEERATRRFNFLLPGLNSRLKTLLLQFADQQGEDFIWNGKRLLDEFEDVEEAPLTQRPPQGTRTATRAKPPPSSRTPSIRQSLPTPSLFSQSRTAGGRTPSTSFRK